MHVTSRDRAVRSLRQLRQEFEQESRSRLKLYNVLLYSSSLEVSDHPPVPRFDGQDFLIRAALIHSPEETAQGHPSEQVVAYYYGLGVRLDRFGELALQASRALGGLSPVLDDLDRNLIQSGGGESWPLGSLPSRFWQLRKRGDIPLWLLVIHALAWHRIPGSLLATRRRIWDSAWPIGGHFTLPYELEERRIELARCPQALNEQLEVNPPPNRFFSELPDDIFACSVYAIDLFLDMVDPQRIDDVVVCDTKRASPSAPAAVAGYHFWQDGENWFLDYSEGDYKESGSYSQLSGFAYYAILLGRVNDSIPAVDLVRAADETLPPINEGAMEALIAQKLEMPEAAQSRYSREDTIDAEGIKKLRLYLDELEAALEMARSNRDLDKEETLESEISEISNYLRKCMNIRGKSRNLIIDDRERARKNVYGSLRRARERIALKMPRLAKHLEDSTRSENGCYCYRPEGLRPTWLLWKP